MGPYPKMSPSWTLFPLNICPSANLGRENSFNGSFKKSLLLLQVQWKSIVNLNDRSNQLLIGLPKHQHFIKATAIESSTIGRLMRSGWGGRSCGIDPPCKVAGCQKSMSCCSCWWDKPETRKATGRCGGKSSPTYQLLWDNSLEWRHTSYLKCFVHITVEIDESSPDERVKNFPISDQLLWLSSAMTHSPLRNKAKFTEWMWKGNEIKQ